MSPSLACFSLCLLAAVSVFHSRFCKAACFLLPLVSSWTILLVDAHYDAHYDSSACRPPPGCMDTSLQFAVVGGGISWYGTTQCKMGWWRFGRFLDMLLPVFQTSSVAAFAAGRWKVRQMQKPPERDPWIQLNDQKSPHHLTVLGHPCGSRETRRRPRQPRCRGFMPHSLLHDVQEEDNCLFIHHSQNLALGLLVTPLGSALSIICACI
jgi:hypothetical protein